MKRVRLAPTPGAGTRAPLEERVALLVTLAFALWSALATLFTLGGLSFRSLCFAYSGALPLGVLLLVRFPLGAHPPGAPGREATSARWLLLGLCLLGAALALLEHRPNADDGYYFGGRTIHYLAHPEAVLDLEHHHHALLEWPIRYPLLLLQPLSLFWAYLGAVSGLSGLDVLHYVAPLLGGLLLPLGWYLALLRFVRSPLAAVTGTAAIMGCLCLDGVGPTSFGWFGFTALRLGKGLLLAVFLPLFVAFSKDWFERPGPGSALKLFLLTIACTGLSDSSLFLLPALAALLASGALFARGLSLASLRLVAGYLASLAWLYAVGGYMFAIVDRSELAYLGFDYPSARTFSGQFAWVFGEAPSPFSWIYLLALLGACVGLRDRKDRAFLVGWALAAAALLNPLLFPLVVEHLTSYNAYWRLFYVAPLLLAPGLAVATAVGRLAGSRPAGHALAVLGLAAIAALGNLIGPFASGAVLSRVPLSLTGYKIEESLEQDVRLLLERAEPGGMLAPLRYSEVIPLFTHELPQVAVRGYMLRHAAIANGAPELAESRMRAIALISGYGPPGSLRDLMNLLREQELKNVVVSSRVPALHPLGQLLREQGFRPVLRQRRFSLFVRR